MRDQRQRLRFNAVDHRVEPPIFRDPRLGTVSRERLVLEASFARFRLVEESPA